jgi:UDP-N-acetyl-D-mannosaminuronic acid dehydrogenase
MNISVIGMGYIGLPTAALIASKGLKVVGVDINQDSVDIINQGKIHIVEPELDKLVFEAVSQKNLRATINFEKSDVFIIAVPTPFKDKFKPDLSYVKSAVKKISKVLEKGNLLILESTSPVGTSEKVIEWIKEERPDLSCPKFGDNKISPDINLAYCPERVLPGNIVYELINNDRIIGGITRKCALRAQDFYKIFVKAGCFLSDSRTAELSKLVENSFRDVNIAFANELSLICNKLDIDVWRLIDIANKHPRVNILRPGPGVGGHCIAVDPWFIVDSANKESKLIQTARKINDSMPEFVLRKVKNAVKISGKDRSNLSIACLGLSFKSDIDDLRESPALKIAIKLSLMGFFETLVVEPNIASLPKAFDVNLAKLVLEKEAINNADIIVLLVDHKSFKDIEINLLIDKQIIDTRGIWS